MEPSPAAVPGTTLRIVATTDLGAATVPLRASYGETGTCEGIVQLLERENARQQTLWFDVGDLVVGNPAYPLLGERPWADVAGLPIAVTAAGNHKFTLGPAADEQRTMSASTMALYTAEAGSTSQQALDLLASWTAPPGETARHAEPPVYGAVAFVVEAVGISRGPGSNGERGPC